MNAARQDLERELAEAAGQPQDATTAAAIVVDLENEAYARGWAAGVDSVECVEGGAMLVVCLMMACAGAILGVLGTLIAQHSA
jgi:hypothetical protein